jgi:predicted nuclease of predicted toxin-antitoxin system
MALSPALADWLSQRGHDAVHAARLGLDRAPDEVILERAGHETRIVVTADLDYPRLLALARADGPGLVPFRGGNFSEVEMLDGMARALRAVPDDLVNSVVVIDKHRIRKRRLPLH